MSASQFGNFRELTRDAKLSKRRKTRRGADRKRTKPRKLRRPKAGGRRRKR